MSTTPMHAPDCVDGSKCGEPAHCPPDALPPTWPMPDDLASVLTALGLGDHARPAPPHEVLSAEVLPAIERMRKQLDEAWPDRARLAGTIRVIREGARQRVEIDGRRFPWDCALPVNVPVSRKDRPSVLLQVVAERVEVVDTIARSDATWECALGGEEQPTTATRNHMPPQYEVDGPVCDWHASELRRGHGGVEAGQRP